MSSPSWVTAATIDELSQDQTTQGWMGIEGLASALDRLKTAIGAKPALLYLQNCNKGTIETYYALRGCAHVTLAAQALLGAPNFYYEPLLRSLNGDNAATSMEVAKRIAEFERPDMLTSLVGTDNIRLDELPQRLKPLLEAVRASGIRELRREDLITYAYPDAQGELHADLIGLLAGLSSRIDAVRPHYMEFSTWLWGVMGARRTDGTLKVPTLQGIGLYGIGIHAAAQMPRSMSAIAACHSMLRRVSGIMSPIASPKPEICLKCHHPSPTTNQSRASTDWRDVRGPFDIIGDVHGCADELIALLGKLGYAVRLEGSGDDRRAITTAPKGRRAFFVGDLVDRGPNSPDVLRIVMDMAERGQAFSVIGNHDDKFLRWLKGRDVKLAHGLERTVEQYAGEGEALRARTLAFLETLPSHAWVDDGRLAVAHAGVRESMLGKQLAAGCATSASTATRSGPRGRRRPARTLQLGGRLSRQDGGGLRPHAGRRAGVAEQYDVHRHRLRVRRQADGPALAGARAGLGAGARRRTPPCAAAFGLPPARPAAEAKP